jgi:hypothetical protein
MAKDGERGRRPLDILKEDVWPIVAILGRPEPARPIFDPAGCLLTGVRPPEKMVSKVRAMLRKARSRNPLKAKDVWHTEGGAMSMNSMSVLGTRTHMYLMLHADQQALLKPDMTDRFSERESLLRFVDTADALLSQIHLMEMADDDALEAYSERGRLACEAAAAMNGIPEESVHRCVHAGPWGPMTIPEELLEHSGDMLTREQAEAWSMRPIIKVEWNTKDGTSITISTLDGPIVRTCTDPVASLAAIAALPPV